MDLKKLFSKPISRSGPVLMPPSTSESKENIIEVPEHYKNCNNSLIRKNMALKAEIAALHKKIGQLREENEQQREKIAMLESEVDEEKIDFLIAERFQKKITHLNTITEKTVQMLGQAATDYRDFFCDLKSNIDNAPAIRSELPASLQTKPAISSRPQKMRASANPSLEKVVESPIVKTKQPTASPDRPRAATTSPVSHVTQRRTPRKGRRSANDFVTGTPRTSRGSTPVPSGSPNGSETVRQKRAAASRIASFAEPSLNSKLRRPGKYDEPSPFINTDFA